MFLKRVLNVCELNLNSLSMKRQPEISDIFRANYRNNSADWFTSYPCYLETYTVADIQYLQQYMFPILQVSFVIFFVFLGVGEGGGDKESEIGNRIQKHLIAKNLQTKCFASSWISHAWNFCMGSLLSLSDLTLVFVILSLLQQII